VRRSPEAVQRLLRSIPQHAYVRKLYGNPISCLKELLSETNRTTEWVTTTLDGVEEKALRLKELIDRVESEEEVENLLTR